MSNFRSVLLLLRQFGFTEKTLEIIYKNENSILEVIYDKKHPFYNKYFDIYTANEKNLSMNYNSFKNFTIKFLEMMKEYKRQKVKIYFKYSSNFPKHLFEKGKEPLFLYCCGNLKLLNPSLNKIAIIGARNVTEVGVRKTKKYVNNYVSEDWIIVSGLAKGVDTVAHRETIERKGNTIAVLPTSFENIYPVQNKELFKDILNNNGLVLSIIGPFENTYKSNFLERNTLVARISNRIFIIEASIKSGTLNTVRKGYEFNKEIFYDSDLLNDEVINYIGNFHAINVNSIGG